MSSIGAIRASTAAGARSSPRGLTQTPAREPEVVSGRALIPLQPAAPTDEPPMHTRPRASYLAHLIATRQQLPQTRERRRAEPRDAIAAYAAADAETADEAGQVLVRAV